MPKWQFWIDAGGTFTDCLGLSPAGRIQQFKTLSSGITRGEGQWERAQGRDRSHQPPPFILIDTQRAADPDGFWNGATLRVLNRNGAPLQSFLVDSFQKTTANGLRAANGLTAGRFLLTPFEKSGDREHPTTDTIRYELQTGWSAPVLAIRHILGLPSSATCPAVDVRFGTTRGTNALLTRTGAKTALLTTQGFGDVAIIGNQTRPDLFAIRIKRPEPLHRYVMEVPERIDAQGQVLQPLSLSTRCTIRDLANDQQSEFSTIHEGMTFLKTQGVESLAICLMHAWRNSVHENQLEECAQQAGIEEISRSSDVTPLIRFVPRCETTLLDAYLNPVLRCYMNQLLHQLPGSSVQVMTSNGGLVQSQNFRGRDSVLSGPAGGVVGFSKAATLEGFNRAIGFDMGGTSTDVARFDGAYEFEEETIKAGVRIMAPVLAIETVAAGGGSICGFDGVRLFAGPQSAGAQPGPACYGAGGPLTVTDLNLYLGRIVADRFPFPLDADAVRSRLEALRAQMEDSGTVSVPETLESLAEGLLSIADERMAQAIRRVSVAKGCDPRDYLLVCFGGAGGQHACSVARRLGIRQVLVHPLAGVLSAWGIGQADLHSYRERSVLLPLRDETIEELQSLIEELRDQTFNELLEQHVPRTAVNTIPGTAMLRYQGSDGAIPVEISDASTMQTEFNALHKRLYGYLRSGRLIEVVSIRIECSGRAVNEEISLRADATVNGDGNGDGNGEAPVIDDIETHQRVKAGPQGQQLLRIHGQSMEVPVFERSALGCNQQIRGPAVICDRSSVILVEPDCEAIVTAQQNLMISIGSSHSIRNAPTNPLSSEADPVLLEILVSRMTSIAEQMGETLRRTSISTNVRERLDYSCAIFDHSGRLIVNAPHVPVHLGAMGETVRYILQDHPEMRHGDVFVTNDPFRGGSHLPDVTVVTPVFVEHSNTGEVASTARPDFFVANRAHHAEIGGIQPGSMPPSSTRLAEEGVLIRSRLLIQDGRFLEDELRNLLTQSRYPSRNPSDNLADLVGQAAANTSGVNLLGELCREYSADVIRSYMHHIRTASARKLLQALKTFGDTALRFEDRLDDGSRIAVQIRLASQSVTIDFAGSSDVHPQNLNANRAITTAAVMYALRVFLAEDVSLNEGILEPISLIIPPGLLNPRPTTEENLPAVVGGNVETSQRIVDVLLGALNVAAASQGTMNNLTFGNDSFGYYETICGGSGACQSGDGCSAVHTHMTNTRLTDPEVLEHRYPVRLRRFEIRRGSGGAGRYRGGDGVIREIEFLQELTVSMLSQRRETRPYGLHGGEPGQAGRNLLIQGDGTITNAGRAFTIRVQPGTLLRIETPGGGGWGESR